MTSKIKSGERRRRRRHSLNFSATRGHAVIFIKPEQDACGGDCRKPNRPSDPDGGEENWQKDDCAKNTGHEGKMSEVRCQMPGYQRSDDQKLSSIDRPLLLII